MTTKAELTARYEEAVQSLGETQAEAANEAAQFGDSWPGSSFEIAACAAYVEKCKAELDALTRR